MNCLHCGITLDIQDIPVMLCPRHYFTFFTRPDIQSNNTIETQESFTRVRLSQDNNSVTVTIPNSETCNRMLTEGISGTMGCDADSKLWIYGWYAREVQCG